MSRAVKKEMQLQSDLFSASTGRQYGGWSKKLIWGDNKLILSSLKNGPMRQAIEEQGGVKLIYIDPPFDVGADFSMDIEVGEDTFTKQPSVLEELAYRDTWGKGQDSFLVMIYEGMVLAKDLLTEDGSILLHCDWRLSGNLRLVLDEVFGKDNFRNEIIWHYEKWTTGSKSLQKKSRYNKLTIYDSGTPQIRDVIQLHQTRPFVVKDQGFILPTKSIFNKIIGDSGLETNFANFLESCDDIISYTKNYFAVGFKLDYVKSDENISNYFPDFIIKKSTTEIAIVETKGRQDLDDSHKIKRLKQWCEDVNGLSTDISYSFVFVGQSTFEEYPPENFTDLIGRFRKYQ